MSNLVSKVKGFYEGESALFDGLSDDVVWYETKGLPYGGVYHGKQKIIEGVFSKIMAEWVNFSAVPEELMPVGDDKVLTLGKYVGKHVVSGKTLVADFAHLYTFEDGMVAKFQQFGDSAKFNEAMQ